VSDGTQPRVVTLQGAANFRDLGGLTTGDGRLVRRGRIFRSDVLYKLTDEDMVVLNPLGIRTVIDLRSDHEVRNYAESPLKRAGLQHFHVPITDVTVDPAVEVSLVDQYIGMLRRIREGFGAVFGHLAHDHYPLVINCFAGKDRTGITSALILGAVGVPAAEIAADYALSGENMRRLIQIHRATNVDFAELEIPPQWLEANPDTMLGMLGAIDEEWGSVRGYLEAIGVTQGEIERIAGLLIETD
jgi:protein-tyrosine phosphatase